MARLVLYLIGSVWALYLPGMSIRTYKNDEDILLLAGPLTSVETQLPFEYYYLPFCKGEDYQVNNENLGQALTGDVLERTPYNIKMNHPALCQYLCTKVISRSDLRNLRWMIDRDYRSKWIVDNLPSGMRVSSHSNQINLGLYENGFPLGYQMNGNYYIYNHHHIIIKVHMNSENSWSVVGFLVQPFSLDNSERLVCDTKQFKNLLEISSTYSEKNIKVEEGEYFLHEQADNFQAQYLTNLLNYSYSVSFENSTVKWASRWDVYLYSSGGEVHWISIINSFGMVFLLSCIVANVFKRAVSRDINTYNENSDLEMDSGWKQLKGDIFRQPVYSGLFSIVIGSGVQLICMCICTLFFACIGFLSPEHRGALLTTMLLVFAFTGNIAGYVSGRLFKMFKGNSWKKNALGTAFIFPSTAFLMFFVINLLIRKEESSGAVPFIYLVQLLLIWFGISLPLTFIGAALGYKKPEIENPTQVSRIPKPLPYRSSKAIYILGVLCGALPFFSAFIELSYIMNSIWNHTQFYFLFGFLILCFILVCLVSGEVSILIVYILICREDYRWWWLSIIMPGTSGVYFFIYALVYYFKFLNITRFSSIVLYFGYMLIGSGVFFLVTGTVGFITSFIFIRRIYSLIKLE
jgi:transmembrane 9 superfamily member 2/4